MSASIWELEMKDTVTAGISRMEAQIAASFAKMSQHERQFEREMRSAGVVTKSTSGIASEFMGIVSGVISVAALTAVGTEVIKIGAEMEQTRITYNTLLGSVEKGTEMLKNLKLWADISPFNTQETYAGGQALLAAGVAANKLIPTMNVLGDLAQGNSNKFQMLQTAYSKIVGLGYGDARHINEMAIDAGLPIWKQLEKQFGITRDKAMEMGGVPLDKLQAAMMTMTSKGGMFFDLMKNQAGTVMGRWNTLLSQSQNIAIAAFDKLQPYIAAVIEWGINVLPTVKKALSDLWQIGVKVAHFLHDHLLLIKAIGVAVMVGVAWYATFNALLWLQGTYFSIVGIAQKLYLTYLYLQEGATLQATLAMWGLNTAMLANPLTWVALGLVAVGAALVWAWNHFEGFRKFLYSLWGSVKEVFSNIGTIIWDALKGSAKLIAGIMTANLGMIKEGWKDMQAAMTTGTDAWDKGGHKGTQAFYVDKITREKKEVSRVGGKDLMTDHNLLDKNGKPKSLDGDEDKKGKGAGASHRNVTVTIHQLVGTINLHSTNVKEGLGQIRDHVAEALIGGVRDFETGISQER